MSRSLSDSRSDSAAFTCAARVTVAILSFTAEAPSFHGALSGMKLRVVVDAAADQGQHDQEDDQPEETEEATKHEGDPWSPT